MMAIIKEVRQLTSKIDALMDNIARTPTEDSNLRAYCQKRGRLLTMADALD